MSGGTDPVIEIARLRKAFDGTEALAGIDLAAEAGRVPALLGPNGVGKTTLVRILATLLTPDAGRIRVAGYDPVRQPAAVRSVIGLTGQYLEEADRLAHRIVVIDRGRIIANGSADQLKDRLGRDVIEVRVAGASDFDAAITALAPLLGESSVLDRDRQRLTMPAPEGATTLSSALGYLAQARVAVDDIGIRRPSLDEVFLALTSRRT
jgi:ABC-type multidrug transport system ATPase subunit